MASSSNYVLRLLGVAQMELSEFGGLDESTTVLTKRIRQYCKDLKFDDPGPIADFAWSATFVSWCIWKAGATRSEFKFSVAHAKFVNAAIANTVANSGVFRGRKIDEYAPKVGDIIQMNRGGGKVDYSQAQQSDQYASHSAIVIELFSNGTKSYARTIGGNEGDAIHVTTLELTSSGLVRQRTTNPYICVVQNLKDEPSHDGTGTPLAVAPVVVAGPAPILTTTPVAGALPASMRRHGTFTYSVDKTIADYGSLDNAIAALKRAEMSHVWVRIHGRSAYGSADKVRVKAFIDAAKAAGIAVAGWGWCQGENVGKEAQLALDSVSAFGLTDYLADIEEGVNDAHWTVQEVDEFCAKVRAGLQGAFGVTSFGLIDWHVPKLMTAALPYVDVLAPQVYWHNFPNQKMLDQFTAPNGVKYRKNDPTEYTRLCVDRWRALGGGNAKAIVVTGQAYWGEDGLSQDEAEEKLDAFLSTFSGYGQITGLNWWHFGGSGAMSHAMFEGIIAAKLGSKSYKA